jgi:hypothetical protein
LFGENGSRSNRKEIQRDLYVYDFALKRFIPDVLVSYRRTAMLRRLSRASMVHARAHPPPAIQMSPKNAGTKLEEQFDEPVELPDFLRQLFELAEAVNHEGHFLAGFDRLVSRDFAGSDFADLRIPGGFKLSYKLL